MIIAGILRAICMIVWIFSSNLPMFILGSAILVLGYAFESGTLQAFVYDILKTNGKENDFEKIWGRGSASQLIGVAVALAIGGFLSTYSYELTVGLSAIGPLLATIIILTFPSDTRTGELEKRRYLQILINGVKKAFSNSIFLRVFLHSGIVLASFGVMEHYIPVLLADRLNLSNTFIGIWLAIGVGLSSIGSLLAHKLKEYNWKILYTLTIVFGLLTGCIVFTQSPVILAILVIFYLFYVITWILIEGIIQRSINSEERATITSVNSLVTLTGVAVISLVFGLLADKYGIHIGYGFFGALFLLYFSTASFYLLLRKLRKTKKRESLL
ncbi:MFS transporter [Chloroflexota bacterium]